MSKNLHCYIQSIYNKLTSGSFMYHMVDFPLWLYVVFCVENIKKISETLKIRKNLRKSQPSFQNKTGDFFLSGQSWMNCLYSPILLVETDGCLQSWSSCQYIENNVRSQRQMARVTLHLLFLPETLANCHDW